MAMTARDTSHVASKLTFLGDTPTPTRSPRWAVYACECGWIGKKRVKDVARGFTRSCGCFRKENTGLGSKTHGHSVGRRQTSTLMIWHAMHARCSDPNNVRWSRYGGRGITVCARWNTFENFLADMGERPEGKSIERKNNDFGYSPDNCVWATNTEQLYNRSVTLRLDWRGRTWTTLELSEETGISAANIRNRLTLGWPVDRIATTPLVYRGRKGTH